MPSNRISAYILSGIMGLLIGFFTKPMVIGLVIGTLNLCIAILISKDGK